MRRIAVGLVLLCLFTGIYGGVIQGQTIETDPSTVTISPGNTTNFDVVISGLTNGLERVNVDIDISSDCAADLTGVTNGDLPGFTYLTSTSDISSDGKSVRLVTFTLSDYTGTGGTVYTLQVTGKETGNTSCSIEITKNGINDKDGNDITGEVAVNNGNLEVQSEDTTPPDPDPMTWETEPHSGGADAIEMKATSATDPEGNGVEYYFEETTGNSGGNDSDWQDSNTYTDSSLETGTEYCYRVKARDKSSNQNETDWSEKKCDTPSIQDTPAKFRVDKQGNVYADKSYIGEGFETGGADLAEKVKVTEQVEAGDVLSLDTTNPQHYKKCSKPYSTFASGVVSTEPGMTLGTSDQSTKAILALMGTVPVKATTENGSIHPGDLLTTSSKPGYAMVCNDRSKCASAIIGKALESLEEGEGKIRMLIVN